MAPEIIQNKQLSEKTDIYSLGMVLIEMITIEVPYSEFNLSDHGIIQKIKDGVKPLIIERISDDQAKVFINKLIDPDPNKRPSIAELINDEFLKINDKEDNRKIKLIKIKKRKKKLDIDHHDNIKKDEAYKHKNERNLKKNKVPIKRDFEENSYYEDNHKHEKIMNLSISGFEDKRTNMLSPEKIKARRKTELKNENKNGNKKSTLNKNEGNKKECNIFQQVATSSHECGTFSKCNSDVYHTANTDYFNQNLKNRKEKFTNTNPAINSVTSLNVVQVSQSTNIANKETNIIKIEESIDKKKSHLENENKLRNSVIDNQPRYQIYDSNYNVHLKFLISQDGKLHEIQFTYNLIRDCITDLMEEIQNEFNFSHDNLNHIYETLKKISIYSKFYKHSDILHDNSV
jgi:serine/threonine protein kinase